LALNNKKISDIDLMMKISSIGGFKNLQELEIRNNKITVLSCKVIASHLGFLKILDLRGNGIGDEGVIKIV
jgi:Leucine-rich repeat (LRR) protein